MSTVPLSRRHFLQRSSLALAAGFTACQKTEDERIIDIHQHVNYSGRMNDAFLAHQDAMGVGITILLPAGTEVSTPSTHLGNSNGLAARIFGNQAARSLMEAYPEKFRMFANEVPDLPNAKEVLEKELKNGAIGIGEQKFAVDCDSQWMELIASIAREFAVPVLIHFQHETYNLGFDRFYKILEKFPEVNFIGHAQTWWGNIDKEVKQDDLYPKSPVTPGGITDRYLSDYPNMFGDLSASSGLNALTRDEAHARAFLAKHQDKLLFGTDCNDEVGAGEPCSGATMLATLQRLVPDEKILKKLLFRNARKIMRI